MMKRKELPQATAECTDPQVGGLMAMYQFRRLSAADQLRFEQHTAECRHCLAEVMEIAPVIEGMLETPVTCYPPRAPNRWEQWRTLLPSIGQPAAWAWASALVLVTLTWPVYRSLMDPDRRIRSLAVLEKPEAEVVVFRRAASTFDRALDYYRSNDYRRAAAQWERVLQDKPDQANVPLYLGYCYLQLGETVRGIAALKTATQTARGERAEDARWLLANAYVHNGQVAPARGELEMLMAGHGRHEAAARQLQEALARIQRR